MNCKYVGSRGLLLLADRKSQVAVPDFDGLNPTLYDNLQPNEVLHICPQALNNFVTKVLPNIKTPFILLTNNSDYTIPDDVQKQYEILINHPLLTHWFSQNCIVSHPKLTRIPIGLDYHTLIPRYKKSFSWADPIPIVEDHPCGWGLRKPPIDQEKDLVNFKNLSKPFWERECKAYANFQFLMTTRYGKVDRTDAYNTVLRELVFYEPLRCIRDICWKNMTKYAFVLSPQGNGLDCHRTWEALCLGCIPIIKTSGIDQLFEELPVWIVNSWSEVTEENMKSKINEFRERTFRIERLELSYWRDRIYSAKTAS